jgi:hypothetical protein
MKMSKYFENVFLKVYIGALVLLFLVIVTTPVFIKEGISIFTEELLEVTILFFAVSAGFYIYRKYRKTLSKLEDQYEDLVRYVGGLNLQTVQIENMYNELTKLPKNKRDFIKTLEMLNNNILSAVPIDWVLTRIIDTHSGRTLTEKRTERGDVEPDENIVSEISNKLLIGKQKIHGMNVYYSNHLNSNTLTCNVFPTTEINKHQEVLIRSAVNNINILYLIFKSEVVTEKGV